jgi:undecaprenyl-diphosphatase
MLVGAICAGLAAYASVRFLVRYFTTKTVTPFGIYCLIAGGLAILRFA